ncbi:MAG: hypothetical protein AAGD96_03220 [Chloroflexota bacterium]
MGNRKQSNRFVGGKLQVAPAACNLQRAANKTTQKIKVYKTKEENSLSRIGKNEEIYMCSDDDFSTVGLYQ